MKSNERIGFAGTFRGNPITGEVQRRKLELVVQVATEVWGTARILMSLSIL